MSRSRSIACLFAVTVSLAALVSQPDSVRAQPEDDADPSRKMAVQASSNIKPGLVTLMLTPTVSMDLEIIQWPNGSFSLPVKAFAGLFGLDIQQSEADQRLFFIDPQTHRQVDIHWGASSIDDGILVDNEPYPAGQNPVMRNRNGFLVGDDVYLDQAAFSSLFGVVVKLEPDTGTLTLTTDRKLRLPASEGGDTAGNAPQANVKLIPNPEISHALVDRIYIQHASNYGFQNSQQPVINAHVQRSGFTSLVDTSMLGVSGSLLGMDYYVKPTLTRFNTKANLQNIDWSFQKRLGGHMVSLGSTDAGLSPLSSPSLQVWGIKFASRNAVTPFLSPQASYEFAGKAETGSLVSVQLNSRTVQSVTAADGAYEFEPVFLQGQSVNTVRITERDRQNQEKVLVDKKIAYFPNMLPKGEAGYSSFFGRAPLQFYPLIPDQKNPLLMPQTEKWLLGGRYFYGVSDRLTMGLSAVADQTFGKPKTYYTNLNPLAMDLTGFSSYQRDPNFFSGQNASLSMRYQMSDHWLLTSDVGVGRYQLHPGSRLQLADSGFGKAAQLHLERQGTWFSWFLDTFRYDPAYYTPSVALYGNNLYDKQGIRSGISGTVNKFLPVSYNFNWSRYQTNLQRLIPGGIINASQWNGTINSRISERNNASLSFSLIDGDNHQREFLQRSLDLSWQTQALPWRWQGEVRASHYFTNTVFLPTLMTGIMGTNLSSFQYKNDSLDTSLEIPLDKLRENRIRFAHRLSSFVNYGSVQGYFRFRQFFIEPFAQISYGDKPQTQNRFGIRVGCQFKSGAKFSVSYYKLSSSFQGPSASHSHISTDQFYFDFTDILGLMANHRFRTLGANANGQGIVTGTVFADTRGNGRLDAGELGVRNAQLLVDHQQLITTAADGSFSITGLPVGYHIIEVLPNNLPLTLNADNPVFKLKVREGKTHRFNVALALEGGILSGHLNLVDAHGKKITPKDMILSLNDATGNSVRYTSVNEQGNYKFSNIPPGAYSIDLEQNARRSGRYKMISAPLTVSLPIPAHYEESSDIKNLDMSLLAL